MGDPIDLRLPSVFRPSYEECRAAFLDHARQYGADVTSYVHPTLKGVGNEDLAIDAAFIGAPSAKRLLVMSSGTHGFEGFAGSAVQLDAMARLSEDVATSPEVAILLIHAVNPFGWSHSSRTNENNVDLNRNFVDFTKSLDEHPLAHEIQALNVFSSPTGPDLARILAEATSLMKTHGAAAVGDAIQRGQYFQADGVGFGGDAPQWSNETLRALWPQYLQDCDLVCFIDWHTGLGAYGEPVFLCFDEPSSEGYRLAGSWWGTDALAAADAAYDSGSRPNYSGLLAVAAEGAAKASGAVAVTAVVEFGTFEPLEAAQCLWIDRWLRNAPADADSGSIQMLQVRARKFFNPDDRAWQEKVLTNGRTIIDQALGGLRGWSSSA